MPINDCRKDGKPGFQWGSQKCFTYTAGNDASRKRARAKANAQGAAIRAAGFRETLNKQEIEEAIEEFF